MYLEQRVQQLDVLAADQGKQSESIAKAVAELTVDTQQGFREIKQEQAAMRQELTRLADASDATNERLNQLNRKVDIGFEQVDARFDQLESSQHEMREDMNVMKQDIAGLKTGQELILQILREKLN
ncbi:hypothetical protein IC229_21480 [Spirosoma sp. BT702]|uniref:Uncharacterized protein n=1 Tax=Spirosoma profusum TaxID=2771354 RepID=A0A926XZP1_9BACT|nr:hypothetical protein [Spirosoma profusum]MBD2703231.1 hypothetical protein [Spirosoma profusum]